VSTYYLCGDRLCVCGFLVTVFGECVCVEGGGGVFSETKGDKILIFGIELFLFIINEISCHASRHPLLDSHKCLSTSVQREAGNGNCKM